MEALETQRSKHHQQHKDGMEFEASIKAFCKDGGGKDNYKWTTLKYVKLMDGKSQKGRDTLTFTAMNLAIKFEQANHRGRPPSGLRVRTNIQRGKGNLYNNNNRPKQRTNEYLVSVKDGPLLIAGAISAYI